MGGIHLSLGLAAVILSITVAARPPILGTDADFYKTLAFFSACATGVLTFFSAKDSSTLHTNAYRALRAEITKFLADPNYKIEKVQAVLEQQQKALQGHIN
jgi:hypothetical protein